MPFISAIKWIVRIIITTITAKRIVVASVIVWRERVVVTVVANVVLMKTKVVVSLIVR